jgi:hypothetical protein
MYQKLKLEFFDDTPEETQANKCVATPWLRTPVSEKEQ